MPLLTLDQVKALCVARTQDMWPLDKVLNEVTGLETDGLVNLNGSRSDINDFIRNLYYQDEVEVDEDPAGIHLTWCGNTLRVDAVRIDVRPGGVVMAELVFTAPEAKNRPTVVLYQTRVNLLSATDRNYLLRMLHTRRSDVEWDPILARTYDEVVTRARRGKDGGTIGTGPEPGPPVDLLSPFLPSGEPSIIFGQPEGLKSWTALLMAMAVRLPWRDNPFGWKPSSATTNCLYLDYEANQERVDRRLRSLMRGHFGDLSLELEYLPGSLPLCDDVDRILAKVSEKGIGLLVIDSLGGAAGGDLNSPESALRFFGALRRLGVTSLIIAHTSKDTLQHEKSIYGSTFFNAYARSAWECQRTDAGLLPTTAEVALINRKQNDGPRCPAIGVRFRFDDAVTRVETYDVTACPEVVAKGGVSKTQAALAYLKNAGVAVDTTELADYLGMRNQVGLRTLGVLMHRLCRTADNPRGMIVKLEQETPKAPNRWIHIDYYNIQHVVSNTVVHNTTLGGL